MLVFVKMQVASANPGVAKNPVGRGKLGHDQPTSTEVFYEAAKDSVGHSSHRSENRGWRNANPANRKSFWKRTGAGGDGAVPRHGRIRTRIVPEFLHKPD